MCVCVFRGKCTPVAHYCVWASMHGGVNAKPFDTSAGVALMYVTATACFPFPQPCEAPTFPPAPRCLEQPDYHVLENMHTHTHTHIYTQTCTTTPFTIRAKITHSMQLIPLIWSVTGAKWAFCARQGQSSSSTRKSTKFAGKQPKGPEKQPRSYQPQHASTPQLQLHTHARTHTHTHTHTHSHTHTHTHTE